MGGSDGGKTGTGIWGNMKTQNTQKDNNVHLEATSGQITNKDKP